MYSLLVTSRTDAWESRSYEFQSDRFLQAGYTDERLRSQFLALTPEAVLALQQVPVVFAYEGRSADVRVGYLRRIVDRRRERGTVFIEFDFEWRLPSIPFARIEPLRSALDLGDKWELNTTHWSIKDVDLFRVLSGAGFTLGASGSAQPHPAATALPSPRGATLTEEAALPLLLAALRRLGETGMRPLVARRQGRDGIVLSDEYDVQDVVEALLRSLYIDVRAEEPTPSSAGSYSRMDMQVRSHKLGIEIKITKPGRAERAIKDEILRDLHDYQGHPHVKTVVVAVYDLANTFSNPAGFENDLTGRHNNIDVVVLVVQSLLRRA